ncbi:hypothetical protein BCO19218_01485 [Burkholderia contaminans]|nr:hypothetical protein BCO19218_01485 [Burkholderia contaminans]
MPPPTAPGLQQCTTRSGGAGPVAPAMTEMTDSIIQGLTLTAPRTYSSTMHESITFMIEPINTTEGDWAMRFSHTLRLMTCPATQS